MNRKAIIVAVAVLSMVPLAAAATEPFVSGGCQLQIPTGWTPVRRGEMGPPGQKDFYVSTLQAPTADLITQQVTGMGGKVVYDKPNLRLVEVTLTNAGKSSKQFWAITKTAPSCSGIATTPAGPQEAQAKAVAETISRAPAPAR